MQSVSSRIWTRVAVSNSYDDNHYTTGTSIPFHNPSVTVPKALITIGIIVPFVFHSFFNSLARSRYLSFFLFSFNYILWSTGTAKSTILQVLFFLLIITRFGRLAVIRWSVSMSKSYRSLCVLFSRTDAGLCIYHLFVRSNWISCTILRGSPCPPMWLIVLSLLPHNLHLLFCCVLSILALIWLVLMALFDASIRKDSVSLLRFPLLSHVHVFSCEMLLICRLKGP